MDILIVANGVPNRNNPLLGIFEFDQAKALKEEGHNVLFFGVDLRSIRRKRHWGIEHEIKDGIECYCINVPVGAVPVNIFCFIGVFALNILYNHVYINRKQPDIIHAHFTEIGYMSGKLSKKKKIPLVITEHSSAMNQERGNAMLLRYAQYGYECANQVIAVSTALKNNLSAKTRITPKVIPNVLSTENFSDVKRVVHEGFGYIITANLVPIKNHELLLSAFKSLQKRCPDVYLGIIGDGELRDDLENYVVANEMQNHVIFYGQKSREDIAELYRQYDCFVLPSNSETFGVAYIEAMAAGLPVIASKCGGPEDFVDSCNGMLVDVGNKEQLEQAMYFVKNNRELFDEVSIKQSVVERFSPQAVAKQLITVYCSIIKEKDE